MHNNTLTDLPLEELRGICNKFNIPKYGSKKIIADRIQRELLYETFTFLKLDNEITVKSFRFNPVFEKIKTEKDFYEHELLDKLGKLLSENSVIIDVGGNSGNNTLYFLKICGFKKSFVFEPKKSSIQLIRENAALNNVEERIEINSSRISAISSKSSGTFWYNTGNNVHIDKLSCVRVSTLDNIFANMDEKISLIKIDTGGYEKEVLKGAMIVIDKHKPVICVAPLVKSENQDDYDEEGEALCELIGSDRYNLHSSSGTIPGSYAHIFTPKIVN